MTNSQQTSFSIVKTESISSKFRNKTRTFTLATSKQHSFGSIAMAITEGKEIKVIQIGKKKKNCQCFADDLILYIEYPKDTIRKLLALITEFNKVSGYKTNSQKSLHSCTLAAKNQQKKLRRK